MAPVSENRQFSGDICRGTTTTNLKSQCQPATWRKLSPCQGPTSPLKSSSGTRPAARGSKALIEFTTGMPLLLWSSTTSPREILFSRRPSTGSKTSRPMPPLFWCWASAATRAIYISNLRCRCQICNNSLPNTELISRTSAALCKILGSMRYSRK